MCTPEVLSVVSENPGVSPRTVAKSKAWEFGVSKEKTSRLQSMYAKRDILTPDSVRKALNEDDDLPNFTKTTLWRLMKDMGFMYDKRIRSLGIIVWRRRYLRAIKEFRRQDRGESLMNFSGMCDLQLAELERGHLSIQPARAASS
ncbi:hypothetical protein HPB48_011088 [Haemaphysalis longicornis]|uniref:Uncharacterized protein n=1 Tax=Haemaphysalis longicornis TaxID=44386 RepID=A0A9J6GUP3_HAELO|nr:hypothetical protein HPB48_011088 [Haemaphysalis longicornis]